MKKIRLRAHADFEIDKIIFVEVTDPSYKVKNILINEILEYVDWEFDYVEDILDDTPTLES